MEANCETAFRVEEEEAIDVGMGRLGCQYMEGLYQFLVMSGCGSFGRLMAW